MPGRQSHGGLVSKQPKIKINSKKRSINAFAIAAQQNPENVKIRQHRLGNSEGGKRPPKRVRSGDEDLDNENESSLKKPRSNAVKGRFDELDIDAGSDSEGNEWRMGQIDSDDDSDLDSDEAFGESDEERFEGFTFSGSSKRGMAQKKVKSMESKGNTLSEMENNSENSSASEDDDLGDEAVDLATMLDDMEDDEPNTSKQGKQASGVEDIRSGEEESDASSEAIDEESSVFSMDSSDENDPNKIMALQSLIANLPQADASKASMRQRSDGASEYNTPSDFGVTTKTKLTLEDLGLPSIRDPFVKKSLKLLASESKSGGKGGGTSGKLEVPLAKRQQDRLDRSAAYEKSKETLDKWTDTVQNNRRAEHLIFPLPDPDTESANKNVQLQPTTNSKPFNDLEAAIQKILEDSGLANTSGKDDEDKLREFEDLETNKMSIEEVKARRDQLRMARDLMFREEARAKRIKKIKSKSYRKVHRKQREKEDRISKQALLDAGVQPSEDEEELQDRRRAEERMGAKHRASKWAKATKQTGRAAWDEDARSGVTEMARRDEELRKRVEGRTTRKLGSEGSDSSVTDSENESTNDERGEQARLLHRLEGLGTFDASKGSGPGSNLANMNFMLKAEASRKKENDATVQQIRNYLASGDSSDESTEEAGDVGRRTYGSSGKHGKEKTKTTSRQSNQFEELGSSNDDGMEEIHTTNQNREAPASSVLDKHKSTQIPRQKSTPNVSTTNNVGTSLEGGAWSRPVVDKDVVNGSGARRRKQKLESAADVEELDLSNAVVIAKQAQPRKKAVTKQSTLQMEGSDEEGSGDDTVRLPFAIRDQELIKRAFAGADVVGEFEAEKRQTIMDEDEKVIDNTLPGWGSWVGDGVSKKDKRQNKGRFLTVSEGTKEQNRKDAKLDRVIINEKRVKKIGKYLASSLPHPFETRQQYERSLRLPVGPEWTTKETFQDATKPRILMKQGIIAPMSKPML